MNFLSALADIGILLIHVSCFCGAYISVGNTDSKLMCGRSQEGCHCSDGVVGAEGQGSGVLFTLSGVAWGGQ